jgi:hypothetical protein
MGWFPRYLKARLYKLWRKTYRKGTALQGMENDVLLKGMASAVP